MAWTRNDEQQEAIVEINSTNLRTTINVIHGSQQWNVNNNKITGKKVKKTRNIQRTYMKKCMGCIVCCIIYQVPSTPRYLVILFDYSESEETTSFWLLSLIGILWTAIAYINCVLCNSYSIKIICCQFFFFGFFGEQRAVEFDSKKMTLDSL